MTDKMKIELKKEMLEDLANTYYNNFVRTEDLKMIEKTIYRYERNLALFEEYNAETWDEIEKTIDKPLNLCYN